MKGSPLLRTIAAYVFSHRYRTYKGPGTRISLGTASLVLFSTGIIHCDSSQVSSAITETSISPGELTAKDERHPQLAGTSIAQSQSEKSTLDRLKSAFSTLQSKLSEFEAPNIRFPPEHFGLPPHFREWVDKIRAEVSFSPGSIADEIWQESQDPVRNPELELDARVFLGNEFSNEELAFYAKRRQFTKKALAKYLAINENEIDERDIPIIAIAGSGGGYRAMLGASGYFKAMKNAGLFDCVTYMAGVSGSCWAINTYLTYGERSIDKTIQHFKTRLGTSFTDLTAAFPLFTERPTNKYLLRGLVERFEEGYTELGIVDIFGTLLASRIMVPTNELSVQDDWLKLSNQRKYIDNGEQPLPIYTAVRHEIPVKATLKEKENNSHKDNNHKDNEKVNDPESSEGNGLSNIAINGERHQYLQRPAREESWFQWFELTPYYVGCEEIEAWIPTYGLGRRIVGSAFCATLSHYYAEIRPFLPTSYAIFRSLDELMKEKDADLIAVHLIQPASIPNFVLGLRDSLPSTCPESLKTEQEIKLMDGGMSNNLPFYPLLRRNVDIIIALDSSADIQTTPWFERTDGSTISDVTNPGYVRQKRIIGWPVGAGWPKDTSPKENAEELTTAEPSTSQEAQTTLGIAKQQLDSEEPVDPMTQKYGLSHCNIWVGTKAERTDADEPQKSNRLPPTLDDSWTLAPDAGIMLIYLPLLPNPKCPGVVPETSDYMSTWNFAYTPEQIDNVVELAQRNFESGEERIRRAVRCTWIRNRDARLQREREERTLEKGRALVGEAFGILRPS